MAATGGELILYLGLGQSLLALVPRLRPLGDAAGPIDPERAWVFAPSGEPAVARDPTLDLPEGILGEPFAHVRKRRSGPLTAASAMILAALGPQDRLLTVNLARRNSSITAFLPGGAAFRNVDACLRRAAVIAAGQGLRFQRVIVSWVQGQADARAPHNDHVERLGELVDGLGAAVKAATGGTGRLVFCLSQTTAFYPAGRRGVPLAQLEFALARPGQVILAGPEYMLERSDGAHLKPRGAIRLGAMHGRAICHALAGGSWEPLRMASARVAGREVQVTFTGGDGDLEVVGRASGPVEVGVRVLEHFGFAWQSPRGPTERIVAARLSGPRTVTLDLSQPPPGLDNTYLTLGFPEGIGTPEGFVDGDPDTARGGATCLRVRGAAAGPFGERVEDWALQQRIAPGWSQTA